MQSRPKNKTAAERDPTRVKENDEAKSNEKNKTQQRKKKEFTMKRQRRRGKEGIRAIMMQEEDIVDVILKHREEVEERRRCDFSSLLFFFLSLRCRAAAISLQVTDETLNSTHHHTSFSARPIFFLFTQHINSRSIYTRLSSQLFLFCFLPRHGGHDRSLLYSIQHHQSSEHNSEKNKSRICRLKEAKHE